MKLTPSGDWFIGKKTEFEKKIEAVQEQYNREGLSIWGTKNCDRCAACCYYFKVESVETPQFEACRHLKSVDCQLQNDKPADCAHYACYGGNFGRGTNSQRYHLMRIAVDILKTKTPEDIVKVFKTPLKPKPKEPINLPKSEIEGFLGWSF